MDTVGGKTGCVSCQTPAAQDAQCLRTGREYDELACCWQVFNGYFRTIREDLFLESLTSQLSRSIKPKSRLTFCPISLPRIMMTRSPHVVFKPHPTGLIMHHSLRPLPVTPTRNADSRCTGSLIFLIFAIAPALVAPPLIAQPPPPAQPPAALRPSTPADDSSAAIKQQIAAGKWDEAATLAQQQFDAIEPGNDDAAKWAITLSKLRVEILLRSPMNDEPSLAVAAAAPIQRILTAYPDHRFAAWLRFQQLAIDAALARRRGLSIQAAPGDDQQRLAALAALIKNASELLELQNEAVESISKAFADREQPGRIDQWMSLRNAIATERVGVLLSRGELFPADSDDYLAAASEANQAAIDALAMVRDDAAVQSDLITMRCDALLRMGQPEEASRLIAPLMTPDNGAGNNKPAISDATRAMAVRIAIELNQLPAAKKWLDSHYGDQPFKAPPSPQSDLARLRFLIASESKLTENWIEAILERGGDYLYRRAQSVAIELLEPEAMKGASSELIIAEAGGLLRKGDSAAALTLLETHLPNAEDPAAAIEVAKVLSAIMLRAKRPADAAEILAKTAVRFEAFEGSPALMLQAAFMQEQIGNTARSDALLQELMQRWPTARDAFLARSWIVDRIEKTSNTLAAAIAATPSPSIDAAVVAALAAMKEKPEVEGIELQYNSDWQRAESLWVKAFAEIDRFDHSLQLTQSFQDARKLAAQSLGQSKSPAALRCRKMVATLYFDVARLNDPDLRNLRIDDQPLIEWLLAIRTGGAIVVPPFSQENDIRAAAGIALMVDGQQNPAMRKTISNAMIPLLEGVPNTELAHCQALVWNGNWQLAPALLDRWIADRPSGERTDVAAMQAAKLLLQSPDLAAKQVALERYLKLSNDVSTRSPRWHTIKLASIEAMVEAGKPDDAKKLAQYVLITRPPTDAEIKSRYEFFAR